MDGPFRFAGYELDVTAYVLRRRGRPVKLEKIPMEVLILLVQRAGTLVSRSEIQDALWGTAVFVDRDAAINTAIRKIRQALNDDAAKPQFVETVVGKGYRFAALAERRASAVPATTGEGTFPLYVVTRGQKEFTLGKGPTILGRDPAAGVCIDHPSVSRRHASLSIRPDGAVLEDLGSRNGTFLNGRRIDGSVKIDHGAIIGLGPITLTFVVLRAPASTQSVDAGHTAD